MQEAGNPDVQVNSLSAALRQRIFNGAILRRPATPASLALVDDLMLAIRSVLGPRPRACGDEVHEALADLRLAVMREPRWRAALGTLVDETGFVVDRQRVDVPRLRALAPHLTEAEAPHGAYAVHRDTWYANPQAQINWWLALHDLEPGESFAFYPEHFATPIANDSALLDFDALMAQFASGRPPASVPVPDTQVRPPPSMARRFRLARGEALLFSAAHLHGGVPVTTGQVRFSLDFRTVDEDDLVAGRGAPQVDVHCRGRAEADFVPLSGLASATSAADVAALLARVDPLRFEPPSSSDGAA